MDVFVAEEGFFAKADALSWQRADLASFYLGHL